ncbi:MAG: riboflavin synthase [Legionella sp.]|nr:MAG: riboflavin synthase [Legionella sp.]
MFSGIVETLGTIQLMNSNADAVVFHIQPQMTFADLHIGDSVAVNGVCLTITELLPQSFSVTAVPETLRLTNLGILQQGDQVNLERALLVGGRNGGHNVQGHVDSVGTIAAIEEDGKEAWLIKFTIPMALSKYIVKKGFITIDGMSITVIDAQADWFTVTLIPHTRDVTIANTYQVGTKVNIEVDIMGKYIEKLVEAYK